MADGFAKRAMPQRNGASELDGPPVELLDIFYEDASGVDYPRSITGWNLV